MKLCSSTQDYGERGKTTTPKEFPLTNKILGAVHLDENIREKLQNFLQQSEEHSLITSWTLKG